jgi:asparaginyl-tRNA synthetase
MDTLSISDIKPVALDDATSPGLALHKTTIEGLFKRRRIRVKELLAAGLATVGQSVTVKGWAKTLREAGAGAFAFLEINDGSCFMGLQVVVSKDTPGFDAVMSSGGTGASFCVIGDVVESPAKGQLIEVKATHVTVYGNVHDPATYPMPKKRLTLEHLRDNAHLRARSNIHSAAMRVRNAMAQATHSFFNERGFLYIHTPLITASDCEGAGEMFAVTTLFNHHADGNLPKTQDGKAIDFSKDFFDKPAFLTVSGQLNVETHCCALGDVYTFGPTFRAENSNTARHLAEFWMIEPEIAFANLSDDIDLAEDYLKYCAQYALDNCAEDLDFFNQNVEKGLIERLKSTIATPFIRLSYSDAIELINKPEHLKKGKFEKKPKWGDDLGSEHERYITEQVYQKPVCLYNYPKEIKAFYMRLNDDNKTVAAVDVLVPKIGEIIGGSQREERLEVLEARIVEATGHDPKEYSWYCDLRRYGSVPHAGFGCGFERLVRFVTGIENIRDVIPFPRWPGNAAF